MSVPPGASYQASNTYVKLKRTLLKLEEPVRIQFKDEWEWGSPLYDWYHRRSCCLIKTMQLRKENNAPFFHEYVVFELYNGAGCFRIDRRQLPDETVPLDCIYEQGVEAYDTIEEVTSLGDSHYSPSDCLATIDVTPQSGPVLQLEFILKSLWAIHQDPSSRVYTLQRYNCYFVAQTIFLLAAKGGSSFRFEHYSLEDSSNKLPGLDWNAMYPSVAGGYSSIHASNRGVHYHFDPSPEIATCHIQALPLTLGHLLRQLRECDQGFHTMCIIHFDDCPFCLKLRAPFQAAPTPSGFNTARESSLGRLNRVYGNKGGLTLADITASGTNQSPESLVSNDSSRSCGTLELPMGLQSADATLSRFEGVILRFWRDCLSHALEVSNKDASNLIYTVCNTDTYLGQQKTLEQSVFELFDKTFALDAATRSSWSTCYHEALRKLARDLDPMVQRTLECLTWEPCLTPGVNPENVANPRRTENWVESMAMLLDSEFNRLEKALKVEPPKSRW